jgi:predicted transcriptional regulator
MSTKPPKEIQIGIGNSTKTAKGFIDAWKRAEYSEKVEAEERLFFESLETLLETLTSGRWKLLKTLRTKGPLSVRALAGEQGRDYKNVHRDVQLLERVGLIGRTQDNKVEVPWDIVEARLKLAA